jgi:hypothetical protein
MMSMFPIAVVLAACPWLPQEKALREAEPTSDSSSAAASGEVKPAIPSLDFAAAIQPLETDTNVGAAGLSDPFPLPSARGEDAEPYANIYRKFSVSLGGALYDNFHSEAQVSGDAGVGTIIDFEDLLKVDDNRQVGRVDLHYSFNQRHWLDATYYDIRRSGSSRPTEQDIEFGDIIIPEGSQVDSDFDTRIFKIAYRYNFVTDERTVIGGSFGIHSMNLKVAVDAGGAGLHESFSQELPLPLVGLHGAYALSKKWSLLADAEILQFDVGDFSGYVSDNRLSLNHDTFDNFGWGVALNGFYIDGSAEGDHGLESEVKYGYNGLLLYLRFYM